MPDAQRARQHLLDRIVIDSGQSQPSVAAFETIAGFRSPDAQRIAGLCNMLFWKPTSRVSRIALTYLKWAISRGVLPPQNLMLIKIKMCRHGLCILLFWVLVERSWQNVLGRALFGFKAVGSHEHLSRFIGKRKSSLPAF